MILLSPFIFFLLVWSLFWKGLALWHAARRGQPWWFLVLLLVNTLGLLEIIYVFLISRLHYEELFSPHVSAVCDVGGRRQQQQERQRQHEEQRQRDIEAHRAQMQQHHDDTLRRDSAAQPAA